jgi:hypothetical protein
MLVASPAGKGQARPPAQGFAPNDDELARMVKAADLDRAWCELGCASVCYHA